jgi:hypothetical protein
VGKERARLFQEDLAKARTPEAPHRSREEFAVPSSGSAICGREVSAPASLRAERRGYDCTKAKLVLEFDGGGHADHRETKLDETEAVSLRGLDSGPCGCGNTDVLQNPDGVVKTNAEALLAPSP